MFPICPTPRSLHPRHMYKPHIEHGRAACGGRGQQFSETSRWRNSELGRWGDFHISSTCTTRYFLNLNFSRFAAPSIPLCAVPMRTSKVVGAGQVGQGGGIDRLPSLSDRLKTDRHHPQASYTGMLALTYVVQALTNNLFA